MEPELELVLEQWNKSWGILPDPPDLRPNFNWRRLHSLPESRRYPEDEEDYQEIVKRHRAVLDELRRGEDRLVFLRWDYEGGDPATVLGYEPTFEEDLVLFIELSSQEKKEADITFYKHVYIMGKIVDLKTWDFEKAVRAVAVDHFGTNGFMLTDLAATWLFGPYDGGMDFFSLDPALTDLIFKAHPEWHLIGPGMA